MSKWFKINLSSTIKTVLGEAKSLTHPVFCYYTEWLKVSASISAWVPNKTVTTKQQIFCFWNWIVQWYFCSIFEKTWEKYIQIIHWSFWLHSKHWLCRTICRPSQAATAESRWKLSGFNSVGSSASFAYFKWNIFSCHSLHKWSKWSVT